MTDLEQQYIESLQGKEKQAYDIAKDCLGCLLDVKRTNGYKAWIDSQTIEVKIGGNKIKITPIGGGGGTVHVKSRIQRRSY
jgi:hypothetical protein